MRLGLSSAAAPDLDLGALAEVARRRGLYALELRAGDAHGVALDDSAHWGDALAALGSAGVACAAYRAADGAPAAALAALSQALGACVVLAGERAIERAAGVRTQGGRAAVLVRGADAVGEAETVIAAGADVAWEADPYAAHVGDQARALLPMGERLVHVTLVGGGPEVAMQQGQGVGELMGRIALAGWDGAVAVAPSSPRYRVAWQQWLGRRGGTGCGSKGSDASLVRQLNTV